MLVWGKIQYAFHSTVRRPRWKSNTNFPISRYRDNINFRVSKLRTAILNWILVMKIPPHPPTSAWGSRIGQDVTPYSRLIWRAYADKTSNTSVTSTYFFFPLKLLNYFFFSPSPLGSTCAETGGRSDHSHLRWHVVGRSTSCSTCTPAAAAPHILGPIHMAWHITLNHQIELN